MTLFYLDPIILNTFLITVRQITSNIAHVMVTDLPGVENYVMIIF